MSNDLTWRWGVDRQQQPPFHIHRLGEEADINKELTVAPSKKAENRKKTYIDKLINLGENLMQVNGKKHNSVKDQL